LRSPRLLGSVSARTLLDVGRERITPAARWSSGKSLSRQSTTSSVPEDRSRVIQLYLVRPATGYRAACLLD
jgi:hypothetical protein